MCKHDIERNKLIHHFVSLPLRYRLRKVSYGVICIVFDLSLIMGSLLELEVLKDYTGRKNEVKMR